MTADLPLIISVDDHVVEPPTLWTDRLPQKYLDRAPRVERDTAQFCVDLPPASTALFYTGPADRLESLHLTP